MSGDPNNSESIGIYQYAGLLFFLKVRDIFKRLNTQKNKNLLLYVSLFEIYGGKIFDLLNNRKMLRMLEDGQNKVQVCELTEISSETAQSALKTIAEGARLRSQGRTSANINSSRSHSILQITLKKKFLSPK